MRGLVVAAGRDPASFPMQLSAPLAREAGLVLASLRAYAEAGFDRLGVHIPSFEASDKIPMGDYIRRLEMVHREVWPAVQGL